MPFADHIIEIIDLRFPEINAVKIKKIEEANAKQYFEEVYKLAKPLIDNYSSHREASRFLSKFFPKLLIADHCEFLKAYFARACYVLAKACYKIKQSEMGFQYLADLMQFGLLKNHIPNRPETLEQFTMDIVNYRKIESTQPYPSFLSVYHEMKKKTLLMKP